MGSYASSLNRHWSSGTLRKSWTKKEMGACGSLCDCLGATRRPDVEPPIENPFKPTPAQSSKTVYWIEGPHPAGVKY